MNFVGHLHLSEEDLEQMADELLAKDLKCKKCNKTRKEEYPILSINQLDRRRRKEIPFSSLNLSEKIKLGIPTVE
jgi:hypothetical protein